MRQVVCGLDLGSVVGWALWIVTYISVILVGHICSYAIAYSSYKYSYRKAWRRPASGFAVTICEKNKNR